MAHFRKYYNLLIIPGIAIIAMSLLSGFRNISEEEIGKNLLKERTSILQDYYFGGITKEETVSRLSEIETNPILSEDIENMDKYVDTDFHYVKGMNFKNFYIENHFQGYITYKTNIIWNMRGPEGLYETEGRYHIVINKSGNNYILSKMILLE